MINDKIFKYFVMGTDPAVGLHSSVYAKSKIQAHIIGNTEQGTDMIAKGIDELMQ